PRCRRRSRRRPAPRATSARRGCAATRAGRPRARRRGRPSSGPRHGRPLPRAPAYAGAVRILLVSQMYPGAGDPDLGVFVAQVERALLARGHEIDRAVLDARRGGKLRYLTLAARTARASRPDVVYAHFLVP